MKSSITRKAATGLPAKAQDFNGVFAFLFNLIDLLTSFFGLFDLLAGLFGSGDDTTS